MEVLEVGLCFWSLSMEPQLHLRVLDQAVHALLYWIQQSNLTETCSKHRPLHMILSFSILVSS